MARKDMDFLESKIAKRGRPPGEQKETPAHLAVRELILENEVGGMREDKLRNMMERHGETTARISNPANDLVELHRRRHGYKTKKIALNDALIKATQDYYFNDDSLDVLEKIKSEQGFKTVGEAIDYLVKKYEDSVN